MTDDLKITEKKKRKKEKERSGMITVLFFEDGFVVPPCEYGYMCPRF